MKKEKNSLLPISEVCPDCIEPMEQQKKKMGGCVNWFVCPKCGYRERPAAASITHKKMGDFIGGIRAKNSRTANQ